MKMKQNLHVLILYLHQHIDSLNDNQYYCHFFCDRGIIISCVHVIVHTSAHHTSVPFYQSQQSCLKKITFHNFPVYCSSSTITGKIIVCIDHFTININRLFSVHLLDSAILANDTVFLFLPLKKESEEGFWQYWLCNSLHENPLINEYVTMTLVPFKLPDMTNFGCPVAMCLEHLQGHILLPVQRALLCRLACHLKHLRW